MTSAAAMLDAYPGDLGVMNEVERRALIRCIDICFECAQACTACADACLREDDLGELVKCVRLNLDCADICETTGRVLSRETGHDVDLIRGILEACAQACRSCGDECERHARTHDQCRICAEVCRRCERECQDMLTAIR
jgi:hypothetical protein